MKVLGFSFTISTLLGSVARSISSPVFFRWWVGGGGAEGVARGRKWDTAGTSGGHGASNPAEPNSVCAQNGFISRPVPNHFPDLTEGAAVSTRSR